jgi:hypothetical protein
VTPRASRDPDDEFIAFYEKYPRKSGPKKAFESWVRLSEKEKKTALLIIPSHAKWYKDRKTKMEFIPLCTSWLNGKMWLRNDLE